MEFSKPTEHHHFLERLVGEWVYITSTGHKDYDPDNPDMRWTETVRSLGGLWFICESEGGMGDGTRSSMVMTLGYDPRSGDYVGTWIGSMMDKLWIYRGWVENDGKRLVLEAEGPGFDDPGQTLIYRDIIEFMDADNRLFSGTVRQPDGTFKTFMTSHARRITA